MAEEQAETCGHCEGSGTIEVVIGETMSLPMICTRCAGTGKVERKDDG